MPVCVNVWGGWVRASKPVAPPPRRTRHMGHRRPHLAPHTCPRLFFFFFLWCMRRVLCVWGVYWLCGFAVVRDASPLRVFHSLRCGMRAVAVWGSWFLQSVPPPLLCIRAHVAMCVQCSVQCAACDCTAVTRNLAGWRHQLHVPVSARRTLVHVVSAALWLLFTALNAPLACATTHAARSHILHAILSFVCVCVRTCVTVVCACRVAVVTGSAEHLLELVLKAIPSADQKVRATAVVRVEEFDVVMYRHNTRFPPVCLLVSVSCSRRPRSNLRRP